MWTRQLELFVILSFSTLFLLFVFIGPHRVLAIFPIIGMATGTVTFFLSRGRIEKLKGSGRIVLSSFGFYIYMPVGGIVLTSLSLVSEWSSKVPFLSVALVTGRYDVFLLALLTLGLFFQSTIIVFGAVLIPENTKEGKGS
ncbi:MAG: hypothetical protein A3D67_03055 [Candidatus Lloydbacteria bacterium RIFCSPHIGHO2_02_FULL_51_22]|uniref:Uncharacterized protein n=2 Tax=Candidatus Lloydiibacteriota TaxID=1817910 RepID=A0A1G2D798_9BACT|nr:MAG: hypothetical protein A3D67_03055 [Candidatus Lloydbacteria bacterium RIFCSPHIGHO2_02_FULL_51_22]OGZ16824.1 MAG: hypothetical protein A3G11_01480 [Candidatus Lloydbacteria bacterium RIFCSPLOWO2_12_FULL_51_9]